MKRLISLMVMMAVAVVMGFGLGVAQATLLVYEPFDYTAGTDLGGQAGGTGFDVASSWNTNVSNGGFVQIQPAGAASGVYLNDGATVNPFTATYAHLPSTGNYAGMNNGGLGATALAAGVADHIFMWRKLDSTVTATFANGNTTWVSYSSAWGYNANTRAPTLAIGAGIIYNDGNRGDGVTTGPGNSSKEAIAVGGISVSSGNVTGTLNGVSTTFGGTAMIRAQYYDTAGVRTYTPYSNGCVGAANISSTTGTGPLPGDNGRWNMGGKGAAAYAIPYGYSDANCPSTTKAMGDNASHVNITVAKIQWGAGPGGVDIVSFYVFHDLDALTEAAFTSGACSFTNSVTSNPSTFNYLSIGGGRYFVDEIRIGTTFDDVVGAGAPPTTTATYSLGAYPPGTRIESGVGGFLPWIAKGDLPVGSILRSVALDMTIETSDCGDSWLSDFLVYFDSDPGNPGTTAPLQVGGDYVGAVGTVGEMAGWSGGDNSPPYSLSETKTMGVDWSGTVDLHDVQVALGDMYCGSTFSGTITLTYDVAASTKVYGLTATPGDAQVALSWTEFLGATSYKVKRALGTGGPYTEIAAPTTNSYVDSDVTNETAYYYVVTAMSGATESDPSDEVMVTPAAPSASLSTVAASVVNVRADGAATSTITVTLRDTLNRLMAGKAVTLARTGGAGGGTPVIATVTGTTGADGKAIFTVSCDTAGAYEFTATVTAGSVALDSKPTLTFVTPTSPMTIHVNIDTSVRAGLSGPAGGSGATWNTCIKDGASALLDSSGAASAVRFSSTTSNGDPWGSPSLTMLTYGAFMWTSTDSYNIVITNLIAGRKYDLYIGSHYPNETGSKGTFSTANTVANGASHPCDNGGPGGNSSTWVEGVNYVYFQSIVADANNKITITGVGDATHRLMFNGFQLIEVVPGTPTGLAATAGDGQIALAWSPAADATGYNVWTSNSVTTAVTVDSAASTNFTKTGLSNGVLYYFKVQGTNSSGAGSYSSMVNAIPTLPYYICAVTNLNPLGYWRLNETATLSDTAFDSNAGTKHNGSYPAGKTPAAGAIVGDSDQAESFAYASTQYMLVPFNAALNPESFTAEMWYYPNTVDTSGFTSGLACPMSSCFFAANRTGWLIYQNNSSLNLRMYQNNGTATSLNVTTAAGTLTAGIWHHVVVTYDKTSNTATLYVNNAVGASGNPVSFVPSAGGGTAVGARYDTGFPMPCSVDEFAIYNTALSAGRVTAHYQNGINSPARSQAYNLEVLSDNPVAYYRLGEGAFTAVTAVNSGSLGAAANGTYSTGGATSGQPGPSNPPNTGFGTNNTAVSFDGTGNVNCGNNGAFNGSAFSISAWVKSSGFANYMNIMAKGGTLWRLNCNNTANTLSWTVPGGGVAGAVPVADGNWHHVVATAGPGGTKLYVDGVQDGTTGGAYDNTTNTDPLYIGSQGNAGAYQWVGTIDEAAFFSGELSLAQVQTLYAARIAPTMPLAPSNVTATAGFQQVALTWDPSSGATGYSVWTSNSVTTAVTIDPASTTNYTKSGLNNGTLYYFKVSASNSVGESAYSDMTNAMPVALVPPTTPTLVAAGPGDGLVGLSWEPSSGADAYNVLTSNSVTMAVTTNMAMGTNYVKTGLSNGTLYWFSVSASNSAGESAYSGMLSAMPAAAGGIWINDGTGNWGTPLNWTNNVIASGSGQTADFNQVDITADRTAHLDFPLTIGALTFGDTATGTAAGWTLDNNGTPANTLTLAGGALTITVNALGAGKGVTISNVIAGSSGMNKAGAGTLTLPANNTLSGAINVAGGGTLSLSGVNAGRLGSIGTSTSGNLVEILPGARLTGAGDCYIGGTGGDNNVVLVSAAGDSGSMTAVLNNFYLGGNAPGNNNSMIVSNGVPADGPYVRAPNGLLIGTGGGSNNSLILTGTSTEFYINANNGSQANVGGNGGAAGNSNSVTVSAGAYMNSKTLFIGKSSNAVTGNWVRVTGSGTQWRLDGNGGFMVGVTANAVSNSLLIDAGGYINAGGFAVSDRNYGIGCEAGANGNWVRVGSSATLQLQIPQVYAIGGFDNGGTGMPVDKPTADGNHLDLVDGGTFSIDKNVYLMGSNSAFNLGNGTGISQATIGSAPTTATTNGVVLYKADARLNMNSGRLIANGGNYMVSGPGQVVISGPAYFSTAQSDSLITSPITGPGGTLIKENAGTLTCQDVSGFSGGITVSNGTLKITGATAAGGIGTLKLSAGASLYLVDSAARTHGTSGLNLANGAKFYMDFAGGGFDQISVAGGATASGAITIDLGSPAGVTPGTYTLISATGGLTSGGATYALANSGGGTIVQSDTAIQVTYTVSEAAWSPAGYWYGGVATPGNSMSATNWSRSNIVYEASSLTPSASSSIEFSAVGASQQGSIVLGGSLSVSNVTFNDTVPVSISDGGNTLSVYGAITANENSTINAAVGLAGASPSILSSAAGKVLSLGGAISGNAIAKTGSGTLRLTGTNTLGSLPQINAGTLSIEAGGKLTLTEVPIVANNNISVVVNGSASRLYKTAASVWKIGDSGSGNNLIITNGAAMWFWNAGEQNQQQVAYIGYQSTANNNTVIVSGTGGFQSAQWRGERETTVGQDGSGNSLQLLNGGYANPIHCTIGGSGLANNNYILISGTNSKLEVTGGAGANMTVGGGTGNHLDVNNGGLITSGAYTLSGANAAINLGNGTGIGTLTYRGAGEGQVSLSAATSQFNFNSGRILNVSGSMLSGSGTVNLNGPAYISTTYSDSSISSLIAGSGSLIKEDTGTLTLTAANTYNGSTVITNGTLALGASGSISNSALIHLVAGSSAFNVSAVVGGYHLANGQELKGVGTVTGSVTADSGSKLNPGNSIGTLTVSGGLTLTPGMTNAFELGSSATPGTTHDQVVVTGALNVNGVQWGDFHITTNAGFDVGTYHLFNAGSLSGSLGAITNGAIGALSGSIGLDAGTSDLVLTVTPPSALSKTTVIMFQ